jgi:hypothetical protein
LKDHCPAYITWQQYQANRKQVASNRARSQSRGAPREGSALLKGLLLCGRCGCRMIVQYDRSQRGHGADLNRPRYACNRHAIEYGQKLCQSLAGSVVDAFVARQMLAVLEPAALELSLSAAENIEQQRAGIDRQWQHRLERARYDADRAARQYHAVEPENRLVARQLERQWEQRLLEQHELEDQYDHFCREQPSTLTEVERELIRTLSSEIPKLWRAPETTPADRQIIVRHLIERIVVTAPTDSQHVDLTIHWAGGFTSQHALVRPVARYDQLDNYEELLGRILELRDQKKTAAQIAEQLNREAYRPPKRRATFNAGMIRQLLWRRVRPTKRPRAGESQTLSENEWWITDLVRHLQIPYATLYNYLRRGWLHARQLPVAGGRWIIWADADELDRLQRLHTCPRIWLNQPQAADLRMPKHRPGT